MVYQYFHRSVNFKYEVWYMKILRSAIHALMNFSLPSINKQNPFYTFYSVSFIYFTYVQFLHHLDQRQAIIYIKMKENFESHNIFYFFK